MHLGRWFQLYLLVLLHLNSVENARQCSGIVCAFRLVELQNTCASIRQTPYRGA